MQHHASGITRFVDRKWGEGVMHFLPQLEHQEVARRTDQRGSKEGEADLQAYKKKMS